jgi:SAM-dependent methyltransferase
MFLEMKEEEIRPEHILERYLALSRDDAQVLLKESNRFQDVICPACESAENKLWFTKNGFTIKVCQACRSIYCSPRPDAAQIKNFYIQSKSSEFWAKEFFPSVAEARKEKLFKPKAKALMDLLHERKRNPHDICDVGAGYGLFLDELKRGFPQGRLFAVEPGRDLSYVCRSKGFPVLEKTVEEASEWHGRFDLVTCMEVIEHVFSPFLFVKSLHDLLKEGGTVFITGLSGEGFDIQVLGKHSKSVHPPHHLNFLSVEGYQRIFERCGFSNIEIFTPGELDVDIVLNAFTKGEGNEPFVSTLLRRGEETRNALQKFLVEQRLSSHLWVLACRRPSIRGEEEP